MKRLVKLLVSLGLHATDRMRASVLRLAGRKAPPQCVVLYYHPVPASQRNRFAAQMDYLRRATKPIHADHEDPLEPGQHYCALTFDDAYVSVLDNALPVLRERGIPCTIFVPTGSLGRAPEWVRDPDHPFAGETVMNRQQLGALADDALVSIGSHSISHPSFLRLSPEEARVQLSEPKAALEEILGQPVETFSFPHGACNGELVEMARTVGYRRVFTINPESLSSLTDRFTCGRVLADPRDWPLEFRLKVLGAYRWMAWRRRHSQPADPASVQNTDPRLAES